MLRNAPHSPQKLGAVVASCIVIGSDRGAEAANPFYFHRAQPLVRAVDELTAEYPEVRIRTAGSELRGSPGDPQRYRTLRDLVASEIAERPGRIEQVCAAAWQAISRSRLDHWVGDTYETDHEEITATDLMRKANDPSASGTLRGEGAKDPEILVVIPFRDRSADGNRMRNLLACLLSLRDQSIDRHRYRVCVVESDDAPRWQQQLAELADDYVFAPKRDVFNKSWAVNVGVREAAADDSVICILDADALVDRDFLARNGDRFRRPGTGGFLPFRELSYLDPSASNYAIAARCRDGAADFDPSALRTFMVHRAPGVCVWLRRDVFDAVDGMDERYEGWGREDMDFVLRLQLATAFLHFDDPMYHLHHPVSVHLVNGQTVNAHIPWLSWRPERPIGVLDRFASGPV